MHNYLKYMNYFFNNNKTQFWVFVCVLVKCTIFLLLKNLELRGNYI